MRNVERLRAGLLLALALGCASPGEIRLETEDDQLVYALGRVIAGNLEPYRLDARDVELLNRGLTDALQGRETAVALDDYRAEAEALPQQRLKAALLAERQASEAFLEQAALEEGAVTSSSGMILKPLRNGDGATPGPSDTVKVHYRGMLRDGTVFDGTAAGEPSTYRLAGLIPCMQEALQRLREGAQALVVCPAHLAFGDKGVPPMILGGAAISFELELIEIVKEPAAESGES
jgi:FKBP-type peptidyl-prolyl cis-trans isomerase FkpA